MPPEFEEVRERRERLGLDKHDEVWEGVYHMVPPPSYAHERTLIKLGVLLEAVAERAGLEAAGGVGVGNGEQDYRVPDLSLHRPGAGGQWHPTAALAVEILSPHDTAWDKLGFYAAHHVDELLYVDLERREVTWMALEGHTYRRVAGSALIELDGATVASRLGLR